MNESQDIVPIIIAIGLVLFVIFALITNNISNQNVLVIIQLMINLLAVLLGVKIGTIYVQSKSSK